jgi:hypothetical protein
MQLQPLTKRYTEALCSTVMLTVNNEACRLSF